MYGLNPFYNCPRSSSFDVKPTDQGMSNTIRQLTLGEFLFEIGITHWEENDFYVHHNRPQVTNPAIPYPFRLSHFTIAIVTDGALYPVINLEEYTVSRNHLMLFLPSHLMSPQKRLGDNFAVSGIMFRKEFLLEHIANTRFLQKFRFLEADAIPVLELTDDQVTILQHYFAIIGELSTRKTQPHWKDIVRNQIESLIYEVDAIYESGATQVQKRFSRKEELSHRFHNLLNRHFREQRSVSFYASELNVTAKYLSTAVKEVSGRTAGDAIDDIVVMEAKVLLKNTQLSIVEVSDQLHFNDQFFFSQYFKKRTGLSPSDYRNTP